MYVYLLLSKNYDVFKIGKTINPKVRIKRLAKSFDYAFSGSWVIECDSEDKAVIIEGRLQSMFSEWNIENMPRIEGYTEFYDSSCFDLVLSSLITPECDFIEGVEQMYPLESINDLPPWA